MNSTQLIACLLLVSVGAEAGPLAAPQSGSVVAGSLAPFIRNDGQTAPDVAFQTSALGGTLFITETGELVLALPPLAGSEIREVVISEAFKRANPLVPAGVQPSSARVSFYKGKAPARWQTNVPTYERIMLANAYQGVDIELHKHGNTVEKLFRVHPGGDPSAISVQLSGADRIGVTESGELAVHTRGGTLRFTKPVGYTINQQRQHPVGVTYRLTDDGYGFDVADYDTRHHLVIDPILQSTYLGSGETDEARGLAIHPASGDVYVTGTTPSTAFPGTAGGAQAVAGGANDVYVARLNGDLSMIRQVTYLGGRGDDNGYSIAIHPDTGDVYVCGDTNSVDFPVADGAAQPGNAGGRDAFVARLDADLTRLRSSTYFGGRDNDRAFRVGSFISAAQQRIYISGDTLSDDLPATAAGAQPAASLGWDGFVASLDADLSRLWHASYLGGSQHDHVAAMAINPVNGKILVTGYTSSDDFPGTIDGAQSTWNGADDGFVAILEPDARELRRATYLGGSETDRPSGIVVQSSTNDVYVAGFTDSDDFPVTPDGFQTERQGLNDLFVARLDAGVMSIRHATYLGGSANDSATGEQSIALDPVTGAVYAAGWTRTDDFPGTDGGAQPVRAGESDVVVARLSGELDRLEQATYLGGSGNEVYNILALAPASAEIYVMGKTGSSDFPATVDGAQASNAGRDDAFVARLDATLAGETEWKSLLLYAVSFLLVIGAIALIGSRLTRKQAD